MRALRRLCTIEVAKPTDIAIIDGNPLGDQVAQEDVIAVILGGRRAYPFCVPCLDLYSYPFSIIRFLIGVLVTPPNLVGPNWRCWKFFMRNMQ